MKVPVDDDPRCRLCDTSVTEYWPVHLGYGGGILIADICPVCKAEIVDT
jgi:hypothetical protein